MATVAIELPHDRYEVRIEPGALGRLGQWVRQVAPHQRAALMVVQTIGETFGQAAQQSLSTADYDVLTVPVPDGEQAKHLQTAHALYDALLEAHMERRSPIVALGGGVITDTVGFVAATYLRGVPLIQCPTTLLAMVDASVGGKVGVNLPQGKNMVGCFYQPRMVVIDPETLTTLPQRELRCGLAECVKHAVIRDADLFDWTEANLDAIFALDPATIVELVRRNVQIKANVVMADEKESGERAHLNFGHTFAQAIEPTQQYGGYHHGEAVALGMVAATRLAVSLGRCEPTVTERLVNLLDRIGLPTQADDLASNDQLLTAMSLDKKVADGRLRFVLPDRLGAVSIVTDVATAHINAAWDSLRA